MQIEIDTVEETNASGRVINVCAKTKIEVPLDGSYSVLALEKVKSHLDAYLNAVLPTCLVAHFDHSDETVDDILREMYDYDGKIEDFAFCIEGAYHRELSNPSLPSLPKGGDK